MRQIQLLIITNTGNSYVEIETSNDKTNLRQRTEIPIVNVEIVIQLVFIETSFHKCQTHRLLVFKVKIACQ